MQRKIWSLKWLGACNTAASGNELPSVILFFRFLGIFPGGVVLRGTLARCPADERRAIEQKYSTPPPGLSSETIKVLFDQPRVFFGASGVLNFEVGPNTTVYLDTTYLDDRVRIGRWQPLSRHLLGRA